MTEFKSQLESLTPCKELLFNGTPGFGRYASLLSHSIAHPAKMNTRLTEFLILELTKPREIVLDPMSGTGQTGVVAALNGRDAVCVELEEKFHNWQLRAKQKLEVAQTFTAKGSLFCIQGDARKLSELLQSVDAVVMSPPYADQNSRERKPDATRNIRGRGNIGAPYDAVVTSPPYSGSITGSDPNPERRAKRIIAAGYNPKEFLGGESRVAIIECRYSERENKANIGNLAHGDIDAIITSPPYSEGIGHKAGENASHEHEARLAMQAKYTNQMVSEGNIAILKHGEIDTIITSPPYGEAQDGKGIAVNGYQGSKHSPTDLVGQRSYMPDKFETKGNISNLKFGNVDAVITSPPYEKTVKDHGKSDRANKINIEKRNLSSWSYNAENLANIGNTQKETYLQAMLTVYSEMFKVLKPNGTAAIIVKPFIRNKQVVDLPFQTWLLMQKCGFKLTRLFKLRLDQQSFWRILYAKKYPLVPLINHEYVLVCEKPSEIMLLKSSEKNREIKQ